MIRVGKYLYFGCERHGEKRGAETQWYDMKPNNGLRALHPPWARADREQETWEAEEWWGQEEMNLLKGF